MLMFYKSTTNFSVYYDTSLSNGPTLAQSVIDYCEYDLVRLGMLFGNIPLPLPITVNLIPGGGGAFNVPATKTITCFCSASTVAATVPATVVAEEAEMFMVAQGKGWNPGWSNGEALSRVSATILYPNFAINFGSANAWLVVSRADWVDNVEHTDTDNISYGCGTLFLNYLANQLNYTWPAIIAAGAPNTNTLAETASILGATNAWTNFINLIDAHFPPGSGLPSESTSFGQPPGPTDNPFPLGSPPTSPALYVRHNLADNGTSHTGPLADSPDIISKNAPVANPQATYSMPASVNSDTQSDPSVLTNQTNYVYLRVWNRGADAKNVFALVYWSLPSTLVSPAIWTLVGSAYFPDVPAGSVVQVSNPGITWPADQLPGLGHNCFVATVGDADDPAANSGSFASYNDFVNYIAAHNNITWRNFNVVAGAMHQIKFPGGFTALPFLITGAWDKSHVFTLETEAELPQGSRLALQTAEWIGKGLRPAVTEFEEFEDDKTDPNNRRRMRLPLRPQRTHPLGQIELPMNTATASHMLVDIPPERHVGAYKIVIRQLDGGREVGRITWLMQPAK
jgi:hypothetical protein